jgi:hypothetical protein
MAAAINALPNYTVAILLGWFRSTTVVTPPAAFYVGLYNSDPTDNGTGGAELTGLAYSRQAVNWGAVTNRQMVNAADVVFPIATGNWVGVNYVVLFDAPTGGNMVAKTALPSVLQVNSGFTARFLANTLVFGMN